MQKSDRLVLVLLVGGILLMLLWMMRGANLLPSSNTPLAGFGIGPGETAPPIRAEGWINGEAPTEESLQGKVVVVDAWAYWCGYCLRDAPELVSLSQDYQEEEVVFIGLTSEDASTLRESREFVKQARYPWPNGYGAFDTLLQFGNDYVPAAWVVGRDGKVTWNSGMEHMESMRSAIDRALATPPVTNAPANPDVDVSTDIDDNAETNAVSSKSPAE